MSSQDLLVTFMHPLNGSSLDVELSSGLTAGEAIDQLIAQQFLTRSEHRYRLRVKTSGTEMLETQSFEEAKVRSGERILIDHTMPAGGRA